VYSVATENRVTRRKVHAKVSLLLIATWSGWTILAPRREPILPQSRVQVVRSQPPPPLLWPRA